MSLNYQIAILSVSPLLTQVFRYIMDKRGLDYPIYEANMEKAAQIVREQQLDPGLRIFITRGRTYSYLCECTNATLVNVKASYFSYVSLIKKYREQGIKKIAILGFSDQFKHNAEKINHAWDENVSFYAYNWREYTDEALHLLFRQELIRLKNEGFEAFIGNQSIRKIAHELDLICEENPPDTDMVEAALEEAEQLAASILAREEKNQTISAFLKAVPEILLKIDRSGFIQDYNFASRKAFGEHNLNSNIAKIFPDIKLNLISAQKSIQHDIILTYNNKKIIADIAPIIVNTSYSGAIITARFVDEIQKLEQNIRTKLSQKGLLAKANFVDIHGNSQALQQTIHWAKKIAEADGTVLITGESGTGKELFSQSIHNHSLRANAPFVAINCAALSPSVLESELFGYVKGAFTGALSEGKQGVFEIAHKGTIFLDEIGELPTDIQAKLLRVIQEKEIIRIGDTKVIPIDVRIIAATNRNLEEEVNLGRFRADLFYRLNVLTLRLPTLEERREDIPFLSRFFLAQEKTSHEFTTDALDYLKCLSWPGNIRQLKNYIERASVFVDSYMISQSDLEQVYTYSTNGTNMATGAKANCHTSKDQDEKTRIEQALQSVDGHREKAAQALGISTVTLWRKMKKYHMS